MNKKNRHRNQRFAFEEKKSLNFDENLSYEESEIRLIILTSITAFLFLIFKWEVLQKWT